MREKVGAKWNRDGACPRAAGVSTNLASIEAPRFGAPSCRPVAKPAPVIDRILSRRVLREIFGVLYTVLLFPLLLVCAAVLSN